VETFGRKSAILIGVVHLLALLGSPDYQGGGAQPIWNRGLTDAATYAKAGFHRLIVENHGDVPFGGLGSDILRLDAHVAVIADRIRREAGLPVGINVLANAAIHALAIASASGAAIIGVNQLAMPMSPMKG
jgi:predicted TIM-barrel enzyme